jgi:hypothetical protein
LIEGAKVVLAMWWCGGLYPMVGWILAGAGKGSAVAVGRVGL